MAKIYDKSNSTYLPDALIQFNPTKLSDIDAVVFKYGPEGAYAIAQVLIKAAFENMESASADIQSSSIAK